MNQFARLFIVALCSFFSLQAQAALFTSNFGAVVDNVSNCDDCSSTAIAFGSGYNINYFGTTYSSLFIGSNGYVTFDQGHTVFSNEPVNTRDDMVGIAGMVSDLSTEDDELSNIFVNSNTAGQLIVTFDRVFQSGSPSARSTFQLVIRADQFDIPAGEGQIGFFYGDIFDEADVSAGIGDGTTAIVTGEEAFASQVPGTSLSNSDARFYTLNNVGGGPVGPQPGSVPEPASLVLMAGTMLAALLSRRRRS